MIHITAPALALVAVVGYLGINAIVQGVSGIFGNRKEHDKDHR